MLEGIFRLEKIRFLELLSSRDKEEEIQHAVSEVISSKTFIGGEIVEKFEEKFAQRVGAKYCVSVNSGYDALSLALKSLNLTPGSKIIVPGHTFVATWLAVVNSGHEIIPIDINTSDCCINFTKILEKNINADAMLPVHLYGHACNMRRINEIRDELNIAVIEDCAQSFGAWLDGTPIGGHGNTCCWSFYPGKNLGCIGDGGAITTDSRDQFLSLKRLRNYGGLKKYEHDSLGLNSRLDTLQAAVLSVQLRWIDRENLRRQEIAKYYVNNIKNAKLEIIQPNDKSLSAWHLFVVRVDDREAFMNFTSQKNIECGIHYPLNLTHLKPFRRFQDAHLPVSLDHAKRCVSIPIGPHLTDQQVEYISDTINEY